MKKILLCTPSLATGGAEKFAVDIATRLDRERYEVVFAETRNHVDSGLKEQLNSAGVSIADMSGRTYIEMLKRQMNFLKKYKPDVVHANTGSILHIMLACSLLHVPVRIYTVHNEAKLLYGNNKIRKAIYKVAFSLFRFTPVAICPTVKETLIHDMGVRESVIRVVNNGVDTKRFHFYKQHSHETLRIITVGRLCWLKNQNMTINAVCDLRQQGFQIELSLVGDGPDRQKLEDLVKKREAQDYVHFVGLKTNVEDYLNEADIYVSSSKTEGLPLSILEAMGCGLPIIATNAGGTKDIVHNGKNGILIGTDKIEELKTAIVKLYNEKDLRLAFSLGSQEIVKSWSIQSCVEGYLKLYEG